MKKLYKALLEHKKNPYLLWAMRCASALATIVVAIPTIMIYGTHTGKLPHHVRILLCVW